jgi:hypothetical protein
MMNEKNIVAYFLVFSLIGCGASLSTIKTIKDEFEGHTIDRMYSNYLSGGVPLLDDATIELNVSRFESKLGNVSYSLIVRYSGEGWLFIDEGNSLILLIDGESISFMGDGSISSRKVIMGSIVEEFAYYETSTDMIKKIANAQEVRIKIKGKGKRERHFSKTNFDNFKKFANNHIY